MRGNPNGTADHSSYFGRSIDEEVTFSDPVEVPPDRLFVVRARTDRGLEGVWKPISELFVPDEIQCPSCSSANLRGATFCCQCGNRMDGAALPAALLQERGRELDIVRDSEPPSDPRDNREGYEFILNQGTLSLVEPVETVNYEVSSKSSKDASAVPITFWFKGDDFTIVVSERPVGMKWWKKPPVTITEVVKNSHADKLGIKKGYQIKSVGDVNCSGKPYLFIEQALHDALRRLPLVSGGKRR